MTTERLRAELLLILSPVRERRIWRCLSRDDNERKAGPLFLARQRSFAENRTKPGWRSSDRHPASALPRLQMVPRSQIGRSHTPPPRFAIRDRQSKLDDSQGGIAQLVERQLCKLEVRGSNPLASRYFRFAIFDCRFKYLPATGAAKTNRKSAIEIRKFRSVAATGL